MSGASGGRGGGPGPAGEDRTSEFADRLCGAMPDRPAEWVLTDFSELALYRLQADSTFTYLGDPEPDCGPLGPMPAIERIERDVVTHHRIGMREWDTVEHVTIIRTLKLH